MYLLSSSYFFSLYSLVLFLFASLSLASPVSQVEDLRARQNQLIVTGAQNGGVQPRRNINSLSRDEMNVLLLAMQRFQLAPSSNPLSYYQVAGIHGQPYMSWADVQARPGGQNSGYCTHVSPLFSTWHRPYLALFEQALHAHAQDAASEFDGPDRELYGAIARDLRLPYWDWAAPPPGGSVLSDILGMETVTVRTPRGNQVIENPLYSYLFHPETRRHLSTPYERTVRSPVSQAEDAASQNNVVAQRLDRSRDSLRQRLYNLITTYDDFRAFGSSAWAQSNNQDADSLEGVHDTIHGLVGSGGQMSFPSLSAFDPIFFLHHCMVDRVFAMWQVLYPSSYVQPASSEGGTFAISPGVQVDTNTALTPFRSGGGFWSSEASRSTTNFGYVYPETGNNDPATVRRAVNNLYGSGTFRQKRQVPESEASSTTTTTTSNNNTTMDEQQQQLDLNSTVHEYFANVKVGKHSLDGPFFIYVFLGDVETDPASWATDPDLVGLHAVFADQDKMIGGSGAAANMNIKTTAAIPLTETLREKVAVGELESLETDDVTEYLRTALQWRVAMVSFGILVFFLLSFVFTLKITTTNPVRM